MAKLRPWSALRKSWMMWMILVLCHSINILISSDCLDSRIMPSNSNASVRNLELSTKISSSDEYSEGYRPLNLLVVFPLSGQAPRTTSERSRHEKFVVDAWVQLARAATVDFLPPGSSIRVVGMVESQAQCYSDFQASAYAPYYTCSAALSNCLHPEYHIPTMDCIFKEAVHLALHTEIILYANGDIFFSLDGIQAISSVVSSLRRENRHEFLITGRRTEIAEEVIPPQYSRSAHCQLIEYATQEGVLYSPHGMDYFVFPQSAFPRDFPPFLLGRWRWDNALLNYFIASNHPAGMCHT